MEGYFSTGQSLQWAVAPMEEKKFFYVVNFHKRRMWNSGVSNYDTANVLVKTSRPRIIQRLCWCYVPPKIKNFSACNPSWSRICSGIHLCQKVCVCSTCAVVCWQRLHSVGMFDSWADGVRHTLILELHVFQDQVQSVSRSADLNSTEA
jgi:hypothetical protein